MWLFGIIIVVLLIYITIKVSKRNENFINTDSLAVTSNVNLPSSISDVNVFSLMFKGLYAKYKNQFWPFVSTIAANPPLLNVAYPDTSIVYYVASFDSNDTVKLSGIIPNNIYFWSLTIYDTSGLPVTSWNHTLFPNKEYSITLGPNDYKPPDGLYCVIQRVYRTPITPILFPNYVPSISILGKTVIDVSVSDRIHNSLILQELLYKAFNAKFSNVKPGEIFPNVNIYSFFLPNESAMASTFPNSFAKYLIVFPGKNNVIKVKGTLPSQIGYGKPILFISYMASYFNTTETNSNINFTQLSRNYTLYVAYSVQAAMAYGYDATTDQLLLWNSDNTNPILVYRQVSVLNSDLNSTLQTANALFYINNDKESVDGSDIMRLMGDYYPQATVY
jgi:hypothetical protein